MAQLVHLESIHTCNSVVSAHNRYLGVNRFESCVALRIFSLFHIRPSLYSRCLCYYRALLCLYPHILYMCTCTYHTFNAGTKEARSRMTTSRGSDRTSLKQEANRSSLYCCILIRTWKKTETKHSVCPCLVCLCLSRVLLSSIGCKHCQWWEPTIVSWNEEVAQETVMKSCGSSDLFPEQYKFDIYIIK